MIPELNIFGEMSFDTSLHNNIDSKLTLEEYKEKLISLLQPILDKEFYNSPIKQKILIKHDRINFSCPICGDSMQNSNKKRGNFILAGKYANWYKCHNCGDFQKIINFFKYYKVDLKLDTINYMTENLGDFHTHIDAKYDMSLLLDTISIDKYAIDKIEFLNYFKLVEVKDSNIWKWLTNRLQFNQEKFLYNPLKNYLFILNLTQSGKILGVQKRLFIGYNRFKTYKLSMLYELMNKKLDVNEEQLDYLDTLSMIFNICLLNFNKKITLFEGPMDSFLYKNSIANTGANKSLPIDIPVQYFFDDDQTGRKRSLEHIDKNESVFLWDKFKRENGLPFRNKFDLNDVLIWSKENNINLPSLDLYFSNDPLDSIDI